MEIAYGPEALHKFDFHAAPGSVRPAPLIVFVHGGAWRSEDKSQHADLARSLARLSGFPVAVPNYRLTTPRTPLQHPAHASDVLRFLHFLTTWSGPAAEDPPPTRLYLLGHSCSAHILASILLTSPFPELTPSPSLLLAVRAVVVSEGIYDVDALLRSFPAYREWFIADTFGDHAAYPDVNVASYPVQPGGEHIRWLVLHSSGDVLVDQLQSDIMYAHLSSMAITSDVPATTASPRPKVSKNFDELSEDHNELLAGVVYPRIVADFVTVDAAAPL
ncbi:alpha/beta-hydrolase [Dichomitus squalens]|uniref:Alpha/beta-hydrolase n=1 Tax=Dichomitus squalens TaxID=114155 RepID=A0A4Q9QEL1_9APHY|nr:alpha/beta-hydrolase [Dichomitus squalens]